MTIKPNSLTTSYVISITNSFIFTALAIALGITFPQLFHTIGIGSTFLPMFLPTVLLAPVVSLPFLIIATLTTPILSTLFFGMPPIYIAMILIAELSFVGSCIIILRRYLPHWFLIPAVLISERLLLYVLTLLIPSIGIYPESIVASYPGVLMNSTIGILFCYTFYRKISYT